MKIPNTSTVLNSNSVFVSEELKDRIDINQLTGEEDTTEHTNLGSFSLSMIVDGNEICQDVFSIDFKEQKIIIEVDVDAIKLLFFQHEISLTSFNFGNDKIAFEKDSYIKMIKKVSNSGLYHCIIDYIQ
jgi:hypothetical protein